MRAPGLLLGLFVLGAPAAFGQDQFLVGTKLIIKNPRAGVTGNKIFFVAKDATMATPSSMTQSPRCQPYGTGTARLTVSSTAGQSVSINLGGAHCVNWTGDFTGARWKYKDRTGATCSVVQIKGGVLQKAVCRGPHVAFQLGATQGSVAVVLSTGTEPRRWCTTFNDGAQGCVVKQDGSDGRKFVATDCTTPAATCG